VSEPDVALTNGAAPATRNLPDAKPEPALTRLAGALEWRVPVLESRFDMSDSEAHSGADAEIATRIRSGDSLAEEALVVRFQPGLMAIARVRSGGDRAPDLVQETLAAALVNLRRGDWKGEGTLAAYLAGILRHLGSRGRPHPGDTLPARSEPETLSDPQTELEREEAEGRVRRALARVPPRQREVLSLHYLEDRSVEEIADGLRVPRGTVLSRLHHGRRKMAKILNRLRGGRHSLLRGFRTR